MPATSIFLYQSTPLHGSIRLGPSNAPPESALSRFLPIIFYASILAVVGLWLRPLLRDLTVSDRGLAEVRVRLPRAARHRLAHHAADESRHESR